jgi:tocopherol O-methyltransferase
MSAVESAAPRGTSPRFTAAADGGKQGEVQPDSNGFLPLGKGKVKFIELDAEKMGDFFAHEDSSFDAVWISEALSHFPNKALFFQNAYAVLKPGGKLVLADWFKNEGLSDKEFSADIRPIEGTCLLALLVIFSV